ncbi:hypothetical protein [Corynebacterium sanguinis]|uniref:DUF3846 domain-containing protein n=1 Tax=Corynebacterium sanguinis TaxID=2594913 RepID=A0A6C1TWC2_9CORY|nr:hypothetical protein [Corynebacterium sanguinis]TVS26146.1 hypothetical protein EKI59_11165 [Corynebacterium sanguinis]
MSLTTIQLHATGEVTVGSVHPEHSITLDELRDGTGAEWLEVLTARSQAGNTLSFWMDAEGRYGSNQLANITATDVWQRMSGYALGAPIMGDVLVCRTDADGESVGLDDEDAQEVLLLALGE